MLWQLICFDKKEAMNLASEYFVMFIWTQAFPQKDTSERTDKDFYQQGL